MQSHLKTVLAGSAFALLTLVAAMPASADGIDGAQYRQQRSIYQGVRTGEITRREYDRLQSEQARIAAMERRAKMDGFVDPWERNRIHQAQVEAGQHIRSEKHDGQGRWNRWWHRGDGYGHGDYRPYRRWWW